MGAYFIEGLGWMATALVLFVFYLNTRKILEPSSALSLGMNALSGLFMSINAAYHESYPSAAANAVWLVLALSGLSRVRRPTDSSPR